MSIFSKYKAYLISYDLKTPSRNYQNLYNEIMALGKWWHYLESTWIVVSDKTSQEIWNNIAKTIDNNDYVLIIEVKKNNQGWLPKEAWDWIDAYVP